MRARFLCASLFLLATPIVAQRTIVRWSYAPFATPGDAAFIVEGNRIHQACGPFGERGACLYVFSEDKVFHAADGFGAKGSGAFLLEGNDLFRAEGAFASKSTCVLQLDRAKVFRSEGVFCTRSVGGFVLDGNTVYRAEGPFANKADAVLRVEGDVPMIALLAILAGL
ncbi:MAG: hypothetical protein IPM46_01880 [Flavobacteriales bacterium]|nr:hypothetical protein [Flavobacteriales bacterium]